MQRVPCAHWIPIVAVNELGQPYAALVPRETSGSILLMTGLVLDNVPRLAVR
uniref:hypothetical protein n=1 Tax=Acinetobacter baumannii TaxID=470 RepID=UPI002265AC73|nr:hypothetical protein [Acinetobacter baumannii]